MNSRNCVVVVATLDTKAPAAGYLRDQVAAWGLDTILIDPGILGEAPVKADIDRNQVAAAAGTTLEALIATGDKGFCIAQQTEGLCRIVGQLHAEGRLHGIVGLGGGQGTSIVTTAMRTLPIGVPKLMLSTVATGTFRFGSYVGTRDICMMHSVTDILDVNAISRPILRNAANGIAGMVLKLAGEAAADLPAIAITQLGQTTACVMRVKSLLEPLGYQLVPFHASGAGGPAMESLIALGKFAGVIDLSVHEIIDGIFGGIAGAAGRLEALAQHSIPAVVAPGGNDYLLWESVERAPAEYRDRPHLVHNAQMTTFRPTVEEMLVAARAMIEPLNRALGPTIVAVPALGFTANNHEGSPLYQPEGNRAVIAEFREKLRPDIPLVVVEAHINDRPFADAVAGCMAGLLRGEAPEVAARQPQVALGATPP